MDEAQSCRWQTCCQSSGLHSKIYDRWDACNRDDQFQRVKEVEKIVLSLRIETTKSSSNQIDSIRLGSHTQRTSMNTRHYHSKDGTCYCSTKTDHDLLHRQQRLRS